jgi:hypothetical protein
MSDERLLTEEEIDRFVDSKLTEIYSLGKRELTNMGHALTITQTKDEIIRETANYFNEVVIPEKMATANACGYRDAAMKYEQTVIPARIKSAKQEVVEEYETTLIPAAVKAAREELIAEIDLHLDRKNCKEDCIRCVQFSNNCSWWQQLKQKEGGNLIWKM